jgi:hypothetical protein
MLLSIVLVSISWTATAPLAAQQDLLDQLRQLTQDESWQEAATLGRRIVEADPSQGEGWLLLGQSLRSLEQYDDAIDAIHRAIDLDFQPARTNTALAITFSQAGQPARGLEALRIAVEAGLPASVLETYPALETLRKQPEFDEILQTSERLSHPCEHDARYRALDFWVGSWDVFMGDQQVGHNQITKKQSGCLIHESWTSASGSTGESINFFDPKTGSWTQHWVDENGGVVWYTGGPEDEGLHMVGENIDSKGKIKAARVTLSPMKDGTVHHLIEHSDDKGKTWSIWFDATYKPSKDSTAAE